MKLLIMAALKTIFNALIAKPMVFFALRMLAKQSDTLIDDKVVEVVSKAVDGDVDGTRKALMETMEKIDAEFGKK